MDGRADVELVEDVGSKRAQNRPQGALARPHGSKHQGVVESDLPRVLACPARCPVGTNAEGARQYLGCSVTMFQELRARRIVKALRRDWYSFDDLDVAVRLLRQERDSGLQHNHEEDPSSLSSQKQTKPLGRQRHRSSYPKTEELLRKLG